MMDQDVGDPQIDLRVYKDLAFPMIQSMLEQLEMTEDIGIDTRCERAWTF
jgi:hypothetical protein